MTPGFFDIHTHYDAQVFWDPALSSSCWHGVTSVVAGNCGFSLAPTRAPQRGSIVRTLQAVEDMSERMLNAGIEWSFETFGEYLSAVERRGTILNFGCYVGHSPVRLFVMGDEGYEREATPDEISAMRDGRGRGHAVGRHRLRVEFLGQPPRRRRAAGALAQRHQGRVRAVGVGAR